MFKGNVIPHFAHMGQNTEGRIMRSFADLTVVYEYIPTDKSECQPVTQADLDEWNMSEEELYEMALDFLTKEVVTYSTFESFFDTITDIDDPRNNPNSPFFILRMAEFSEGAAAILLPEVMETLIKKFGRCVLIPSSTQEWLIPTVDPAVDELVDMIMDINETEVEPNLRLSDHPYILYEDGSFKSAI